MKDLLIMDSNFNVIAVGKLTDLAQTAEAVTVFASDIQIHGCGHDDS